MAISFDRREHVRHDLDDKPEIEYTLDPFSDEIFEGLVINISRQGLCLFISNPLRAGKEITIKSFMDITSQTAKVRWIEKVDDIHYRTGLVFS
ncbi:MAG: PilZ domain-containing protein [Nitrospirota bacterium]